MAMGWLGKEVCSSSWMFKIHSLKALNSRYESLKSGLLKDSKQLECLGFF